MNKFRISSILVAIAIIMLSVASCKKGPVEDKLTVGFTKYTMPNGLQVILHEDHSNPMMAYAIVYHVGSSREIPGKQALHTCSNIFFSEARRMLSPAGLTR